MLRKDSPWRFKWLNRICTKKKFVAGSESKWIIEKHMAGPLCRFHRWVWKCFLKAEFQLMLWSSAIKLTFQQQQAEIFSPFYRLLSFWCNLYFPSSFAFQKRICISKEFHYQQKISESSMECKSAIWIDQFRFIIKSSWQHKTSEFSNHNRVVWLDVHEWTVGREKLFQELEMPELTLNSGEILCASLIIFQSRKQQTNNELENY